MTTVLAEMQPRRSVSLGSLIERNVALSWHEAVAVIQAISGQLVWQAMNTSSAAVPAPEQIEIDGGGNVTLLPGASPSGDPVRELGHLLSRLLEGTNAPAELRLCVSQATFEKPLHGSVEEFSGALAYFERPDRPAVLAAVHARTYEILQRTPVSGAAPSAANNAPPPTPDKATESARRRRRIILSAAALVCVLTLAFVASAVRGGTGAALLDELTSLSSSAVALSTDAASAVLTEFGVRAANTDLPDPAAEGAAMESSSATQNAGARRTGGASSASRKTDDQLSGTAGGPFVIPGEPMVLAQPPQSRISGPAAHSGPGSGPEGNSRLLRDVPIYTAADADVEPPRPLQPTLPSTTPPGADPEDLGIVELVIDESGHVEWVRLVRPSARFHDRMILSAVKAWRFEPAMRDGKPVKYRQRIRVNL